MQNISKLLENAMTKQEFALHAGISTRQLRKWMNEHWQTIKRFGQNKNSKYLLPQTVQYLSKIYIVTSD